MPRLLRARFDPNKQTMDQIEALWVGLGGGGVEARQAITDNLLPTVDTLIEDASNNKLWRARVGAFGALGEIVVGRSRADLGGAKAIMDDDVIMECISTASTPPGVRLLRLWRTAMRALGNVRSAVRESGETLARIISQFDSALRGAIGKSCCGCYGEAFVSLLSLNGLE